MVGKNMDITVHTIVRNGQDYIKQCVEAVLPFVKKVLVTIDGRSKDKTLQIMTKLKDIWKDKLIIDVFAIDNPITDLVKMRNYQIEKTDTEWCWIVDSDEYWDEKSIKEIKLGNKLAYGCHPYAIWNDEKYHYATSRRATMRFFRKKPGLKWIDNWGKEKLLLNGIDLCNQYVILPIRYIHLTHLKSDRWREEMNMKRNADDRDLRPLPINIISLIKKINHEKTM